MLRCARMTAMTGRTAALVWHGQWQQWAVLVVRHKEREQIINRECTIEKEP
jgi:hypothetical protein